jgi:predicted DsbA family dithiol-disulfide isomerase
MEIDIYSDPICPWCYIGKRRLERALEQRQEHKPRLKWRAFQLNPDMPEGGIDRRQYLALKFGGAGKADQLYDNIRRVGETVGIEFAFDKIERTPNTIQAHRLIQFANDTAHAEMVIEALFQRYFVEGKAIGDIDNLIDIAVQSGLDSETVTSYMRGDENLEEVQREDSGARRLGIQGVPCFIINNQYALSGAQEPEAFFPIFEMAAQEDLISSTAR